MASENSTTDKSTIANTLSSSAVNPVPVTGSSTSNKRNTPAPTSESTYSIDDFAAAFRTLEATPDVIRAALRMAGKTAFTKEEAQAIIKKYQGKEVKA